MDSWTLPFCSMTSFLFCSFSLLIIFHPHQASLLDFHKPDQGSVEEVFLELESVNLNSKRKIWKLNRKNRIEFVIFENWIGIWTGNLKNWTGKLVIGKFKNWFWKLNWKIWIFKFQTDLVFPFPISTKN